MQNEFIPFCLPTIEDEEIHEVVETLRSGWLTTGKKVLRFEEMFRNRLNARHAISTNSATSAWHVTARALGIGAGDEVIVPAITWPSIANVVELVGGRPVFADVDSHSLQMLPSELARLLTPRTKAVIPVHFAGAPFDLDAFRCVLHGRPVHLVEDAAHAAGTFYKNQEVGNSSSLAIFSFHPIKNITTGEGGMIVCQDDELAEKLRLLRFHGISKDAWKRYSKGGSPEFEVVEPGYKFNMMDLQAALGIAQLPKLERFNARRTALASLYGELLKSVEAASPLVNSGYSFRHAWHLYVVKLDLAKLSIERNAFITGLAEANVGAGLHFPAIHLMRYYREKYGYSETDLPQATAAGRSILSLPLYPGMSDQDVHRVVDAVKQVIKHHLR